MKKSTGPFIVLKMQDGKQLVTFNLDVPKIKHLHGELVIGEITAAGPGKLDFTTFKRNKAFVDFYIAYRNSFIKGTALNKEAKRIGNGSVLVFDKRMKDTSGDIPPCEIIGAYEVKDGKPVKPFIYNPQHKILCPEHGPSIMFEELQKTAEKLAYGK